MVRQVLLVLSGKGGVGKSSVAAQLAMTLMAQGHTVGLLDIDLCGPSIPKMLCLSEAKVMQTSTGWLPVEFKSSVAAGSLGVMSIAFLLPNPDDSVVWRGPKKTSMIKQFVDSVNWGSALDYLIIDTPPGTSDEHMAILEALRSNPATAASVTSAIIVTTPQLISVQDVAKEITFCRAVNLQISGVIENMSGYQCPHCSECCQVFSSGGGEALAQEEGLAFLARLPICPAVARLLDGTHASEPADLLEKYQQTQLAAYFEKIAAQIK